MRKKKLVSVKENKDDFNLDIPVGIKGSNWDYSVRISGESIALFSDLHSPFHDKLAIEKSVQYVKDNHKIDTILFNGDVFDFYRISRFSKSDEFSPDSLRREVDTGKAVMREIVKSFKNVKVYFKFGNHDIRLKKYIEDNAPEILGLDEFNIENILGIDKFNIIKEDQKSKIGRLTVLHGHELNAGWGNSVNPARTVFLRTYNNVLVSHHHRQSMNSEKNSDGRVISTWSVGCLCDLSPRFSLNNKWNLGFAVIEVKKGDFFVNNYKIIGTKKGKSYEVVGA